MGSDWPRRWNICHTGKTKKFEGVCFSVHPDPAISDVFSRVGPLDNPMLFPLDI